MEFRCALKRLAFALAVLPVAPLVAIAWLEKRWIDGERWFRGITQTLSLFPGRTGAFLRLAFYRFTLEECSLDVDFEFGTTINHRASRIGHFVSFGSRCSVGIATIGDHVLVASRVSILSGCHQHDVWDTSRSLSQGEAVLERVSIGSNTWIGEGAIVLADVGSRCVVGAGSVVQRPVPCGRAVMGNPARVMPQDFAVRAAAPLNGAMEREVATPSEGSWISTHAG